jgi:hypothetical protein
MTWADFYLVCFLVGFGLSALSFLLGAVNLHFPHIHLPHVHLPHGAHLPHVGHGGEFPWFNFGTLSAFLAWFGGAGFLLQSYHVWAALALGISTLSGIGGASVVFLFVAKILMRHDIPLNPADYDMTGVLGRITISIRPGGTGEIVYSQEGVRRCAGARSEDGAGIPKGAEVMVTRYEKGIAYVTLWEDPLAELELRK